MDKASICIDLQGLGPLLAGILGTGGSIQRGSWEPGLPLIARFRHRTRGITCALKSTRVAHSHQASLRQDITPGLVLFGPLILVEDGEHWASDDALETVEPGALMFRG
ncbi:hypothetical protein F2Q68_00039240 [Brassica cretica]|uniref:Uncharacterized protein n=1 Tax=Brassica cretica TaxID=69181 RepID=A0A8S9MCY0_BRACR|nr:hypothetical protein F2Q68_00039240 [Brassica cretica]